MYNETAGGNTLAALIQYFFEEIPDPPRPRTEFVKSYRDTMTLFLKWLAAHDRATDGRLFHEIRTNDILDFLKHLETKRSNSVATRNSRLAAGPEVFLLSCYLMKPETKPALEILQFIPMKKADTPMIDFFEHDDVLKILGTVDRSCEAGMKDYLMLKPSLRHTGMRASELANMPTDLSGYDPIHGSIEIIGKGRKWRRIYVWPRTVELLNEYIKDWRSTPKPPHHDILIVNRERTALTRSGVNKVCLKYLRKACIKKQVPGAKRSPAHSWRHTAAANMICQGRSLLEVSIRLGHASVETTQKYLQLDLTIRKQRLDELVRLSRVRPSTQTLMSVELKTTEEMVSFLKSV